MSWGNYIEIYVAKQDAKKEIMRETLAAIGTDGELWTPKEIKAFAAELNHFNTEVQKIVTKTGGEGICVRTNT